MKAEFKIDHQELRELADMIIQGLAKILKLHLEAKNKKDELFTVDSLTDYLHVTSQWVYKKVQHKEIPHIKKGGLLRFRKSAIDQALDEGYIPEIKPHSRHLKVLK